MGELGSLVQGMFDALERQDADAALALIDADGEGVDEISRRWIRSGSELTAYVSQLMGMVSDVSSQLNDVHERTIGDIGIVTFWLEQDYTLEGERHHISAPTTVVARRRDGEWKFTLFHSVPLPE
jgi:uncharacterized protein (TIGR02246 family)